MEINFLKWFNFQRGQIIYNKIQKINYTYYKFVVSFDYHDNLT